MSRADFEKFIKSQQVKVEDGSEPFDADRELNEWRDHLKSLYNDITAYMKSYIDAGDASISFEDVELNEEFSGPYTVQRMVLTIGRSTITFKPIGTMLISSKGRVDVQGPRGTARLGLVDRSVSYARQLINITVSTVGVPKQETTNVKKTVDWAWKIINPAPQMSFDELTESSFFDMILNVADA